MKYWGAIILLFNVGLACEFLGDPFTVTTSINNKPTKTQQVLLRCTGKNLVTNGRFVNRTDGGSREFRISPKPLQLEYTSKVIGWVPKDVKLFVAEIYAAIGVPDINVTAESFIHNYISAVTSTSGPGNRRKAFHPHELHSHSHPGNSARHPMQLAAKSDKKAQAALIGSLAGPVGGIAAYALCELFCPDDDLSAVDNQIKALETNVNDYMDKLDNLRSKTKKWNAQVESQFVATNVAIQELEGAAIATANTIEVLGEELDVEAKLRQSLERDVQRGFDDVFERTNVIEGQQVQLSGLIANLSVATDQAIREVYDEISIIVNSINNATVAMNQQAMNDKRVNFNHRQAIENKLNTLATAIRDEVSQRQFRTVTTEGILNMERDPVNADYEIYATQPSVQPDVNQSQVSFLVEKFAVYGVTSGTISTGTLHALSIYSRNIFFAETTRASDTWQDLLKRLGSGCADNCVNDVTCESTCDLWIELETSTCGLANGLGVDAEWWFNSSNSRYEGWRDGKKLSTSDHNGYCESATTSPTSSLILDYEDLEDVVRPLLCAGGTPGTPMWVQAINRNNIMELTSPLDPATTCSGNTFAESLVQTELTFEFAFTTVLSDVVVATQKALPLLDEQIYGKLPSGVTTIQSPLATLVANGRIGRGVYSSIIALFKGDWAPVILYEHKRTIAGVSIEVSGTDDVPANTYNKTVTERSQVTIENENIFATRFIGIGTVADQIQAGAAGFVYDLDYDDMPIGDSRGKYPTFILAPADAGPSGIDIDTWQQLNGEIFDHNLASNSISRRKRMLTNDGKCVPTTTPTVGASICRLLEDSTWDETYVSGVGENRTSTLTLTPKSSSWILTAQVPDGEIISDLTDKCPKVQISGTFGGGITLTLTNTESDQVFVGITTLPVDLQLSPIQVGGNSVWVEDGFSINIQEFVIEVEGKECQRIKTDEVVANNDNQTIFTYTGVVTRQVLEAGILVIDDQTILAADSALTQTSQIQAESLLLVMKILSEQPGLILLPERITEFSDLINKTGALATKAAENAKQNRNNGPFKLTDNSDLEALQEALRLEREAAIVEMNARLDDVRNAVQNSTAGIEVLRAVREEVDKAFDDFVNASNVTFGSIVDTFKAIRDVLGDDDGFIDAGDFRELWRKIKDIAELPFNLFNDLLDIFGSFGAIIIDALIKFAVIAVVALFIYGCWRLYKCYKPDGKKKDDSKEYEKLDSEDTNDLTKDQGEQKTPEIEGKPVSEDNV